MQLLDKILVHLICLYTYIYTETQVSTDTLCKNSSDVETQQEKTSNNDDQLKKKMENSHREKEGTTLKS